MTLYILATLTRRHGEWSRRATYRTHLILSEVEGYEPGR